MVQARRVQPGEIIDFVNPEKPMKEPKWKDYLPLLDDAEPGAEIEFTPDEGETPRGVSMNAARAAHSLGFDVENRATKRNTVLMKVKGTGWEPKPKKAPDAPPSPRG